jgi:hypothetical protein
MTYKDEDLCGLTKFGRDVEFFMKMGSKYFKDGWQRFSRREKMVVQMSDELGSMLWSQFWAILTNFRRKILCFSLKRQSKKLHSSILNKKATNCVAKFFGVNIFKNHHIGPCHHSENRKAGKVAPFWKNRRKLLLCGMGSENEIEAWKLSCKQFGNKKKLLLI